MMMMNMNSNCISSCLEAQAPFKISPTKLDQWVQADKAFLKSKMGSATKQTEHSSPSASSSSAAAVAYFSPLSSPLRSPANGENAIYNENYAFRQRYLRSYTFHAEENKSGGFGTVTGKKKKKWVVIRRKMQKYLKGNCSTEVCAKADWSFYSVFHGLFKVVLLCAAHVDVHHHSK